MTQDHVPQEAAPDSTGKGVSVQVDGQVVTIELNRPPANFFDAGMVETIVAELAAAADDGVRVAVLAAQGKHFCAGADLAGNSGGGELDSRLYDAAAHLFESPIPVVAAVQGAAVGGGLGLALSADFRVATPEARFCANFSRLGFHHGFGLTVSLPEAVGHQFARDMLYTGRNVYGDEAYRVGLCDRLAQVDDVRAEANRLAHELAEAAPLAMSAIRSTMSQGLADRVRAATVRELAEQRILAKTEDFKEGLRASRDRRTPQFRGA
jgi:2-(1,2-epoxy-1,2-dihydrophenyl)acetyl-CoA isomerase